MNIYTAIKNDDEAIAAQEVISLFKNKKYVAIGWLKGVKLEVVETRGESTKALSKMGLTISDLEDLINKSTKTPSNNSFTSIGISKKIDYNIRITYYGQSTHYLTTNNYYSDKGVEVILNHSMNGVQSDKRLAIKYKSPVNKRMLLNTMRVLDLIKN